MIFFRWRWWSTLSCCYVTVEDFNILWRWLVFLRSVGKQICSSAAYQCLHHTLHIVRCLKSKEIEIEVNLLLHWYHGSIVCEDISRWQQEQNTMCTVQGRMAAEQSKQILYQCRPLSSLPSSRVNQIHGTAATNKIHLLQPFTTSTHPSPRAVLFSNAQCAHCSVSLSSNRTSWDLS